eukprot:15422863-Heterocapsa_arctica.AAC.1
MESEDTTHEDNRQIETEQIGNKRSADEDENKEMGKAKQARIEQVDGSIEQEGQSILDKRRKCMESLRDKDNNKTRPVKRRKLT